MSYKLRQFFLTLIFCLSSASVYSFQVDAEGLKKNLGDVQLNKNQVSQMLDVLVAKGKISPQQGEKARKELEGMSDEQMQELTNKAVNQINSAAEKDSSTLDDYLQGIGP